ncbi:MAG: TfoX/Sxy family protein [Pseudomonadota bacterium]
MAFDPDLADQMRADLGLRDGLSERRMFGGLCFLLYGNMVCGIHPGGAMYRVGKGAEAEALSLPSVQPLSFTGRRMGGMVEVEGDAMEEDGIRASLITMSLAHAASLPPK